MKRIIQITVSTALVLGATSKVEGSSTTINNQEPNRGDQALDNFDDLFKLDEDSMIIDAPVPVSEPKHFKQNGKQQLQNAQEVKVPVYEYNDVGDLSVHEVIKNNDHSQIEVDKLSSESDNPKKENLTDAEIIQEMFNEDKEQKSKQHDKHAKRQEERKKHFIHDEERQKRLNGGRGRNRLTYQLFDDVKVADRKRPVYAVLSEPMKSDILYSVSDNLNSGGYLNDIENIQVAPQKPVEAILNSTDEEVSYIPKAHVQFLEQSGVRVVPISYMDDAEQIEAVLDQVNGVYMAGDSQNSIADKRYQKAFGIILSYVKKQNKQQDYFPMFLMGKSSQVLVHSISLHKTHLHDMMNHQNKNLFLRLLQKHDDTFLFHQLQNDSSVSHAFDLGEFFNKQDSGLQMRDIQNDVALKRLMQPLVTFEGSGTVETFYLNKENKQDTDYYNDAEEFVAIAEGRDFPIYMFTYNIEMTQFVHTAIEGRIEQDEVIDKCIAARHHAQFVSHQIADEGRLSDHYFKEESGRVSQYLIRNYEIASVEYPQVGASHNRDRWPLPIGLETHDVYIIKQSKIKELNSKLLKKLDGGESSEEQIIQI